MIFDIILILTIIALSIYIWYLHYIIETWRGICMSWQYLLQSAHRHCDELQAKYDKLNKGEH